MSQSHQSSARAKYIDFSLSVALEMNRRQVCESGPFSTNHDPKCENGPNRNQDAAL
jgi:hypothetical protein